MGPEVGNNVTTGWFSATFSGPTFFPVASPLVGNGDLVGFWQYLGPGRLDQFRARAENKKTQFPGARGPETGKSNFLGNNFFLGWSDQCVVRNGDLVVFWPVLGPGHWEKFWAQAKNRKTQFPGVRGPETGKKKSSHCPQLSYSSRFDRPKPHGR